MAGKTGISGDPNMLSLIFPVGLHHPRKNERK